MSRKSHKNKKYSKELKLQAVQDYISGNGSLREISRKYDGPDLKENVAKIADFIGITSILKADKENTQTEYKKLEIVEGKDTEIKHEKNKFRPAMIGVGFRQTTYTTYTRLTNHRKPNT